MLTETLIISDITKTNLLIVLLYSLLKKVTTNALSHRTQFDGALGNDALRMQPTDQSLIGQQITD